MAKFKKAKPKAKAAKAAKPKASKSGTGSARPAAKKAVAKAKPAAKSKPAAKAKPAPKAKPAAKGKVIARAKPAVKSKPVAKVNSAGSNHKSSASKPDAKKIPPPKPLPPPKPVKMTPFLNGQHKRLLNLRDAMLDSMAGVAKDNLRSRAEGSEASAFGMHQADAGSDAYDRDFALNLLSQEQDALYEIEEALKRVGTGSYGICELCNKPIPHARLEAIPFARFTVDCQSKLEKERKLTRSRQPVTSLFGLTDDEDGADGEEEETPAETKE